VVAVLVVVTHQAILAADHPTSQLCSPSLQLNKVAVVVTVVLVVRDVVLDLVEVEVVIVVVVVQAPVKFELSQHHALMSRGIDSQLLPPNAQSKGVVVVVVADVVHPSC